MSDNLPIFTFTGRPTPRKKASQQIMRTSFNENNVNNLINHLNKTTWSLLYDLNIDQTNDLLTIHIHNSLDIYAPDKVM